MDSRKLIAYQLYDVHEYKIEPAKRGRDWMDTVGPFIYRCLPMTVANRMGWVILNPTDFTVVWDGNGSVTSVKVDIEERYRGMIRSYFGFGIITFSFPFLFRTPPDYGLIVRGAPNHIIPGTNPLEGYVETDWAPSTFTMNWKITEKDKPIKFEKGTPICFLQPYRIADLTEFEPVYEPLSNDPQTQEAYREWSTSRAQFNGRTDRQPHEWQKDYFLTMKMPKVELRGFSSDGP